MWRLLKTEFDYNKSAFWGALAGVIPICVLESLLEDLPSFYVIFPMLWYGMFWIMIRNKEVREFYLVHLPLSRCKLGLARILIIILSSLLVLTFYELIHFIFNFRGSVNYPVSRINLVIYFAIVLFVFSVYLIIRDSTLFFLRTNRFFRLTKNQAKTILSFALLLLNVLFAFTFISRSPLFDKAFRFLFHDNPFSDINNVIRFSVISLALAVLSIVSYCRRKAYLE